MANCNLIIDSCCDLPADVINRDGVYLIKFPYLMNHGSFEDDLFQTTQPHDFYDAMRKGAEPSTAQISIPALQEAFEWAVKSGKPTVYLSFTSGLSGSFDTAEIVCKQVLEEHPEAELYVVDTRLASVAEGLLVYEALEQREKGLSAEHMVKWAEEARFFVDEEFMVEDLESLRRGGRIPASVAFAGAKLDVKPLLTISQDGKLALNGVSRGRKKGIRQLGDYYQSRAANTNKSQFVVIGHADCPKDAQTLSDEITKINPNALVTICNIGPVIGSHVGPGMLAVVFWGNDKREELSVADRIANKVRGAK